MIDFEVLEGASTFKLRVKSIEYWVGSDKVFLGGETQIFNLNLTFSKPEIVK